MKNNNSKSNKDFIFLNLIFYPTLFIILFLICVWIGYYYVNQNHQNESDFDLTGRPNISNNTMQIGNLRAYGNLTIMNRTNITTVLTINSDDCNNSVPIAKFYGNGTVWIRDKQEAKAAEQLIKFQIAYAGYLNGFCDGVRYDK